MAEPKRCPHCGGYMTVHETFPGEKRCFDAQHWRVAGLPLGPLALYWQQLMRQSDSDTEDESENLKKVL